MPVSSPSYFPPNSSSDQIVGINAGKLATSAPSFLAGAQAGNAATTPNIIIIGDKSANGGLTDPVLAGTLVLGAQSLQSLTQSTLTHGAVGNAMTVIGTGSLQSTTRADSCVMVGASILPLCTGQHSTSVMIGAGLGSQIADAVSFQTSVIIGYNAMKATVNFSQGSMVVIGSSALSGNTGANGNSVFIGAGVAPTSGGSGNSVSNNTVIGGGADLAAATSNNVVIGSTASAKTNVNGGNIVIGAGATCGLANGTDLGQSIIIGTAAKGPTATVTGRNIVIGPFAGISLPTTLSDVFVIERNISGGGGQKALLYGSFATGNLLIGNSIDATNRDFGGVPGTNMLKLLNGTAATGATVIGGGYFYVLAGVLHWVDSNGVDFGLSDPTAPTTGASTATFVATNKPGATTGAGPVAWENKVIAGVSYQSPLWAT